MGQVVYFQFKPKQANFSDQEDGTILKDALVLASGTHEDMAGVIHKFSRDRVMQTVHNTNSQIFKGDPIPFKKDHDPSVEADIGEVADLLECRPITENDVAPEFKHLIGELGAFTKIKVRELVDKVKNGTIKNLSPGIDVVENIIREVSAVSKPAIPGMALFGKQMMSYRERRDLLAENSKLREDLKEGFGIFIETVLSYESIPDNSMYYGDREALLRKAIEEYSEDLAEILDVDLMQPEIKTDQEYTNDGIYNTNAYGQNVINPNASSNFSQNTGKVVSLNQQGMKKRRRERTAQ